MSYKNHRIRIFYEKTEEKIKIFKKNKQENTKKKILTLNYYEQVIVSRSVAVM